MTAISPKVRRYYPHTSDFSDADVVRRACADLLNLPTGTPEELIRYVEQWMELRDCVGEQYAAASIATTVNTADETAEARHLHIVENVLPALQKGDFPLKQKFAASPVAAALPEHWRVFARLVATEIDLYREENIPLQTEVSKLRQEFQKITGAWQVELDGQTMTVQQARARLEEPDRALRRRAWLAATAPQFNDRQRLDELYDAMMVLRQQIARNAGFANHRDYVFKDSGRFDYTPEDCHAYHRAIERLIVPLVGDLMQQRARDLGLDSLRPWDLGCDPLGRPAPRPFADGAELAMKVQSVIDKVDPELGGFFSYMRAEGLLDLDSRPNKAPGGYMSSLDERKVPFIFMNAAGTQHDVATLLHESGHADHYFLSRDISPSAYLNPPLEFAEVASMSMELLGLKYYDLVYAPDEKERVIRHQLETILTFLPFMAMIDAFQHWVYTHDSTPDSRADFWEDLDRRFRPHLDWTGLEDRRRMGWQYLHVFKYPFYYIEYGIAQLGALQVWRNSRVDYAGAVAAYKRALTLGGSRPLPELFEAAGGRFDLTEATLGPLVDLLRKELALP